MSFRDRVTWRLQTHQHQVHHGLHIDVIPEVLMVSTREPDTHPVMLVHHAGNSVKPKSVKHVLVHVESQVGQKEPQDLVVTVVEQSAVPKFMSTSGSLVEVTVIRSVKVVQSILGVLGSVGVDDVEKDDHSHSVSSINQGLELVRGSISRRGSEKRIDLVSEGCGICSYIS